MTCKCPLRKESVRFSRTAFSNYYQGLATGKQRKCENKRTVPTNLRFWWLPRTLHHEPQRRKGGRWLFGAGRQGAVRLFCQHAGEGSSELVFLQKVHLGDQLPSSWTCVHDTHTLANEPSPPAPCVPEHAPGTPDREGVACTSLPIIR